MGLIFIKKNNSFLLIFLFWIHKCVLSVPLLVYIQIQLDGYICYIINIPLWVNKRSHVCGLSESALLPLLCLSRLRAAAQRRRIPTQTPLLHPLKRVSTIFQLAN